jgi:hypothetical protein
MRTTTWLTTLGLTLLSATASAQNVTYDYDKGADFGAIKTYAWTVGATLPDELNHKRVVGAIEAQLAAKGLTRVAADANPDVLVAYHAAFDRNVRVSAYASDFGGWRFGGSRTGTANVNEIVNGTLVVDITDPEHSALIWRGMARKELDLEADPEKRDRNMNKAAEKLFKNYPPRK